MVGDQRRNVGAIDVPVWPNLKISSLSEVPPVVTITSTFKCLPSILQTCDVWRASSLVGTRIKAVCGKDCVRE